jgi:hypothetical protein
MAAAKVAMKKHVVFEMVLFEKCLNNLQYISVASAKARTSQTNGYVNGV